MQLYVKKNGWFLNKRYRATTLSIEVTWGKKKSKEKNEQGAGGEERSKPYLNKKLKHTLIRMLIYII